MIAAWILAIAVGFIVTAIASERAVDHASVLARGSRVPPFVVGVTLMAVGTDLPEIANSIAAAAASHGDIVVGNSIGSAATQATLVLGLLPFVGRRSISTAMPGMTTTGWLSAAGAVLFSVLVVADGEVSRFDALLLIVCWLAATRIVYGRAVSQPQLPVDVPHGHRLELIVRTLIALVLVGAGAMLALVGVIEVADELGVPELLISFFALSLGTSLPELVFSFTAIRRGEAALGIGDLLGASLADSTLSIGIGPLLFPIVVGTALAVRAALATAVALMLVSLLLSRLAQHDRRSGAMLLIIYGALFAVMA